MDDQRGRRIQELREELSRLEAGEDAADDPLLERLKVRRRKYTLSPEAIEARRKNAQLSTGPKTEEGKSACARNSWKHGQYAQRRALLFGKPCKSTCPKYPCALVDDGDVAPGQDCLDKEDFLLNLRTLEDAMQTGQLDGVKSLAGVTLAGTISIIQELQYSILEHGVYIKSERLDKDGKVIGYELKPNPSLLSIDRLLKAVGLSLPDMMMTPKEIQKVSDDEENRNTLADIFRTAGGALRQAREQKNG